MKFRKLLVAALGAGLIATPALADAPRERVWALWTDIPGWPSWNPGVVRAELDGPPAEGATGTVRAAGGPASKLRVLAVEPEREAAERACDHRDHDADDGDEDRRAPDGSQLAQVHLEPDLE